MIKRTSLTAGLQTMCRSSPISPITGQSFLTDKSQFVEMFLHGRTPKCPKRWICSYPALGEQVWGMCQ